MKKEVIVTANELLKQLYLRDRDEQELFAFDLPYTGEAIYLLIEENVVAAFEDETPFGEGLCYYTITAEGQKQYERGGFRPRVVLHPLVMTLIMFGAMFLVLVVVVGVLFLLLKVRDGKELR